MRKRIIFSIDNILKLAKEYQKMHMNDNMDDYEHGIVDGLEFVIFLTERME